MDVIIDGDRTADLADYPGATVGAIANAIAGTPDASFTLKADGIVLDPGTKSVPADAQVLELVDVTGVSAAPVVVPLAEVGSVVETDASADHSES